MTRTAKPGKARSRTAARTPKTISEQLLELHLAHELARFDTDALIDWVREELAHELEGVRAIPLDQLIAAEQVRQVIDRHVIQNDLPDALIAFASRAACRQFDAEWHHRTRLNSLITSEQFEAIVDLLLRFPDQRQAAIDHLIDLPVYQELISGILYKAIGRFIIEENIVSKKVPGVSSMLKFGKRVMDRTLPKLEGAFEDKLRAFIAGNLKFLLRESKTFMQDSVTDEELRESALALWASIEDRTLGELQQGMDHEDLSACIALGVDVWTHLRSTDYFRQSADQVIDLFYTEYGEQPVGTLLDALQITPDRLMQEVAAFAPEMLKALKHGGQIERLLRRRLASFYHSDAAQACLQNGSLDVDHA